MALSRIQKIQLLFRKTRFSATIAEVNVRRILMLAGLLVGVHLIHVFVFMLLPEQGADPVVLRWRGGIMRSHATMAAIAGILWSIVRYSLRRSRLQYDSADGSLPRYLVPFAAFAYLTFGSAVAAIDQLVTPAITPFQVATMGVAFIFLLRPGISIVLYTINLLFFQFLLGVAQQQPQLLLSARVNAVTMSVIGLGMSMILYLAKIRELKQIRTIDRQRADLESKKEKLERLLAMRNRIFSIIGHDLRSPVGNSAEILRSILEDQGDFDPDSAKRLLQLIASALDGAYDLLENMLAWGRNLSGEIPFVPRTVDLPLLVEQCLRVVGGSAIRKEIRIDMEMEEGMLVRADSGLLSSILRNLISNAVKFTPRGGRVQVRATRENGSVILSVEDNGRGLSPLMVERLYSLNRADVRRGTEGEPGSGLGLVLCREFVAIHGSVLRVESQEGKGCRFWFRLSCGSVEEESPETQL